MKARPLHHFQYGFLLLLGALAFLPAQAQYKVLKGTIQDRHSSEPVPFASVRLRVSGTGVQADSAGHFRFQLAGWPADTLEITSVGYQDYLYPVQPGTITGDTLHLPVLLAPGKFNVEVVVRSKSNRGLFLWRKIVARKAENDLYHFRNFSYELYNKLELDLKNVNKEKLSEIRLLRPFNFILNNIDTAEGAAILPTYLAESISDYYFQKAPQKRREVFKAVKTLGLQNESITKMMGGMDQVVNFYNNFIPVFDKQFVSPISDNGDAYYRYKVADTQYVGGRRLIHLLFSPRRKGENTFEGDCWVHDTTYAIQKMSLRLGKEANVNFVDRLSLIQEYQLINDTTWFLARDKFVVDLTPFGKNKMSFIGRKTATYRNIAVNAGSVGAELAKNRILEEKILPDGVAEKDDGYWQGARHEELSTQEQRIYHMIDTLQQLPAYQRYANTIYFLTVGYKNIGNYEIGPWYNWISYNSLEGTRLRFDLGTNTRFSKTFFFHGYLAYGFIDRRYKYKLDGTWLLNKSPRTHLYAAYSKDIDFGQSYYDAITQDNVFALAVRKQGVPLKFLMLEEKKLEALHELKNGFSGTLTLQHKVFDPLRNLPPKSVYVAEGASLATAEVSLRIRYAFLEKFLESTFNRISLGSPYPIVDVKLTQGIPGIQRSRYRYTRLSAGVSDYVKIAPYGSLYYNVFGGKTFGTLPYMLLDIAPGNEIYYYNPYAFNMMNRYEYIHDRFTGFHVEHNFGNGIFRFVPITRKLKLRQFWMVKTLWGSLSEANRNLNFYNGYPFESLNGRTYLELGTGVDNILKVLRVDFIWRPLPESKAKVNNQRFGIFGSFRFAF